MTFYDVNRAIDKPDLLGSFRKGQQYGQAMTAAAGERQDNAALRGLAPQIIAGDPGAFDQAAAINPEAAGKYQSAGDAQLKRLKGAIDFIDSAKDPAMKEAYYQQVRPYLARFGKEPPATFAEAQPKMEEARARIAMIGQKNDGRVQSRFVADDGQVWTVMADGSYQPLRREDGTPLKADRQMWLRDQPGIAPGLVGKDGTIMPLAEGGAPQQQPTPQSPLQPGQPQSEEALYAQANQMVQAGMPQAQVESWLTQQLGAPRTVETGGGGGMGAASPARQWTEATPNPYGNAMPTGAAAPRPAISPAEQQRLALAQEANARAAEAAGRAGIPAGYRPDGQGGATFIPGGPADPAVIARNAAAKPSAAASKTTAAIKAKVPQLQNAIRGLGRIETALNALNTPGVNTGPIDQYVVRNLPAGQELDAAVGGIQNSFLALTRVPGIGSQSDLEARIAAMQYPSLDKAPEVNKRTLENLKLFARDLAKAYELAVTQGVPDEQAPSAPAAAGGWSIQEVP